MATLIIWGCGDTQNRTIRNGGETTNQALMIAEQQGWQPGRFGAWAIEGEFDSDQLDADSRFDPAIEGFFIVD